MTSLKELIKKENIKNPKLKKAFDKSILLEGINSDYGDWSAYGDWGAVPPGDYFPYEKKAQKDTYKRN